MKITLLGTATLTAVLCAACASGPDAPPDEAAASSASGGGEGAAGAASSTGGGGPCEPRAQRSCYQGPAGTDGVGSCKAGVETCGDDGSWGACEGQVLPARESCGVGSDEDCDGEVDDGLECPWSHGYFGENGVGDDWGVFQTAVATGPAGEVVFTAAGLEADFGAGPRPGPHHVVKLSAAGQLQWSYSFDALAGAVTIDDAGNVIVAAHAPGAGDLGEGPFGDDSLNETCLIKLDSNGQLLWTRHYPTSTTPYSASSVVALPGGDLLVMDALDGTWGDKSIEGIALPTLGTDVFLARFDAAGHVLWAKALGAESIRAGLMKLDPGGNIYFGGDFQGSIPAWSVSLPPFTPRGFLAKLDGNGDLLWVNAYDNGSTNIGVTEVATDAAGNVSATGYFGGTLDLGGGPMTADSMGNFVARFDPDGARLWSTFWPAEVAEIARIAVTPGGDTRFATSFTGQQTIAGQDFVAATKATLLGTLAPDGSLAAAKVYEDVGGPYLMDLDPHDHPVLFGGFEGTIDFGPGPLTNTTTVETMYITKLLD